MLPLLLNPDLGGIFNTQLLRFRRFFRQGKLHFEKFGEIDALTDLPEGYTALVDYDSNHDVLTVPEVYSICRIIGIHPCSVCYKKTRRGWHLAIVFLERFTSIELIALQAILGDDSMRGALNFMRVRQMQVIDVPEFWRKRSNILYRRKL